MLRGQADREGKSRKSIRAYFINGGKGIAVERDWKVGCEKKKVEKKNGRRTSLEGREKDNQVVTVKSCFSLIDLRLDRRYNRENVSAETDRGFERF